MENQTWYAIVMDENDLDFSRGCYNKNKVDDLCEELQAKYLAAVHDIGNGGYKVQLILPTYRAIR